MLDEIDWAAAREGIAISKLKCHGHRKPDPRNVIRIKPKEEEIDILRILNIIDGRRV